jgi:DNA-directed RNA polymerase specialized sigma24 family protein
MIAITKKESESRAEALQEKFLAMLPIIVRCARVAFRNLAPESRQEAIQETTAIAWTGFRRLADRGKLDVCFPTILAMFCIRQVRAGRQVGSRLNGCDVMSRYAQRRNGFQLQRLDQIDAHDNEWKEILLEDRKVGPAEIAASRIDFASWLRLLPKQRRRIALVLAAGEPTKAAATKFGVSAARISQLRQRLMESWLRFQGEAGNVEQPQLAVA